MEEKLFYNFFFHFKPASLWSCDIADGDSNVICFGSEYGDIDPKCNGEIELTLRTDKLDFWRNKSVHCAFFKQQDLGYVVKKLDM